MSLYQRKDSPHWWVKITHSQGCLQHSTGTADRRAAQEYHDTLKASLWAQQRLGTKPEHTWDEAVVRYLADTTHKASQDDDKSHLRWLDPYLRGVALQTIGRAEIDEITRARRAGGAANATVNRTLEVLRAILRKAVFVWDWLDKAPSLPMLPEPKRRIRWLSRDEADRLLAALPAHLAAMARFSLETGLRRANVTGLEWSQVDLPRRMAWVHPDQAKARKAIAVPLSAGAVVVVQGQWGQHGQRVFTYRGQPVCEVNTKAWKAALVRAGIEHFRWHDLRHTWASWHVQAGTPLHVLQELGGWESVEMVRRYAHLSSAHLAEYVDRMAQYRAADTPRAATIPLRG